ncbi:MAG: transglutaminase domain-containing protein [Phycisphaerales bacterium JB041]
MHKPALTVVLCCVALLGLAAAPSAAQTAAQASAQTAAPSWDEFIAAAEAEFGTDGRAAAEFLTTHRPARDADLSTDFLLTNLRLAMRARHEFPWAAAAPVELFHNDVLPYAVLDETREPWREDFYERARAIVAGATTASEAAQRLNRELFNQINVHYNTGRKRPNQSPSESIAQGRATCTGLSIILVDACRAVGIPARVAGVANWADKRGNHTWVEIWDGAWHFTGADEHDPNGLNRGWFVGDASRAVAGSREHAVWATSWQRTDNPFPMVWAPGDNTVHAVDATDRYAATDGDSPTDARVFVRVWDTRGGERIVASVNVGGTSAHTRAGTADLNDMPELPAPAGKPIEGGAAYGGAVRTFALPGLVRGRHTVDLYWDELWLSKDEAAEVIRREYEALAEARREEAAAALEAEAITVEGTSLRILERTFGDEPEGGHSLWISMHGGGGAPAEVNDRQWRNQIRLYELEEGIYVAPRAPTDTWNLWHQGHIDPLFAALIESYVVARGVNPDRVYLLGYSAGGDGVYQVAPRMADRFAAAAMMAGHPNETTPEGLRNLPFAVLMGGDDNAYNRAKVAAEFGDRLAALREADGEGYEHRTIIYPGLGHWMDGKDAEILPWMASHSREAWPRRVVWKQDDVTHDRFYWLAVPEGTATARATIVAEVSGQTITIESADVQSCTLLLHDALLDLDQPVSVIANGKQVFSGTVRRTEQVIREALAGRLDAGTAPSAKLTVKWE